MLLQNRRTHKFVVALSPNERATLARLQESEGTSGADVLRRLLLQEARLVGVLYLQENGAQAAPGTAVVIDDRSPAGVWDA